VGPGDVKLTKNQFKVKKKKIPPDSDTAWQKKKKKKNQTTKFLPWGTLKPSE
jgi:hypothetical protein